MFGAEDKLCSNLWFKVLILVETDVVSSTLAIEDLKRDLAVVLRSHIELRNSVDSFDDLSSDDCLER